MLSRLVSATRSWLMSFFGLLYEVDDDDRRDTDYIVRPMSAAQERELRRRVMACPPGRVAIIADGGNMPCACDTCQRMREWQADVADLTDWDGFDLPY